MITRLGLLVFAQLGWALTGQEAFASGRDADHAFSAASLADLAGTASIGRSSSLNTMTVPSVDWTAHRANSVANAAIDLRSLSGIAVDGRYADWVDQTGQTLIPPSLHQFATTFASDLSEVHGLDLSVCNASAEETEASGQVFLTIDTASPNRTYIDVAGRETAEGYTLNITESGIVISGASPLGVWWGTRTLLQLAAINNGSLPLGSTIDSPGWRVRGVFLDAGRKFYPPWYIVELCAYMSYFKQNHFQLHLSDNLVSAVTDDAEYVKSLYSAFRLNAEDDVPEVAGLSSARNESYTRAEFDAIQYVCAARGVTIVPEIESPGHALPIVKWKPELALGTDASMLNISVPGTIPAMKQLWSTFLPWVHSKSVHLGADEYNSSFPEEFNALVNALNAHVAEESGKNVQIWGTFPPNDTYSNNIATNVTITHWEFFEDNPLYDYIKKGYEVINADDAFYVVNKWSASCPQQLNKTRIFHGNPATGRPYTPNIFDTKNATNNPTRDEPLVLGQMAAIWNDYGPNGTVYSETYWAWGDNLPALADKQWGGSLTEEQYDAVFELLHAAVPAQNLDMKVKSKGSTIVLYDPAAPGASASNISIPRIVADESGNGYNAENHGCEVSNDGTITFDGNCYISTPLERKGRNFTLSFDVNPDPGGRIDSEESLFGNTDSSLVVGSPQMAMIADGEIFALNYTLPRGQWTRLALVADRNRTLLVANEGERMEFLTVLGVAGTGYHWAEMAFPAPLKYVGKGFKGMMRNISLVDYAI